MSSNTGGNDDDDVCAKNKVDFSLDLLLLIATTAGDGADNDSSKEKQRRRQALGQAEWLKSFWIPTQQRKYSSNNYQLQIEGTIFTVCLVEGNTATTTTASTASTASASASASAVVVDWKKLIQMALKKIIVEDLGDLAARDLWGTIPLEDSEGRGRKDLSKLEKQLSVKVVFLFSSGEDDDDDHILLVGAKNKLEKKCLVIRNVLSHYYWRLKGKQINL